MLSLALTSKEAASNVTGPTLAGIARHRVKQAMNGHGLSGYSAVGRVASGDLSGGRSQVGVPPGHVSVVFLHRRHGSHPSTARMRGPSRGASRVRYSPSSPGWSWFPSARRLGRVLGLTALVAGGLGCSNGD